MILKGSFGDFNISQLLLLINLAKRTGTLRIYGHEAVFVPPFVGMIHAYSDTQHGRQAELYFRDGWVLAVAINDLKTDLVSLLRRQNKLNDRQVQNIEAHYPQLSDQRRAINLIHSGYVRKPDLLNAVTKQTMDMVQDILNWDKDRFEFVEDLPDFTGQVLSPINLSNIISHAVRHDRQRKELEAALPNLEKSIEFHEVSAEKLKELTLTSAEWRVMGYVSRKNTIRQIARACNLTSTEIRQIVVRLMDAGILEVVDKDDASDTQPKPPESRRRKVETQVMQMIKAAAQTISGE